MKLFKSLMFILMGSSAFAAGGIGVIQGDAVTFSSMVVTGNVTMNGTCTGTGCGSGGGGSTNGTITASPQYQVAKYSLIGTTTTVAGDSNFVLWPSSSEITELSGIGVNGIPLAASSLTLYPATGATNNSGNLLLIGGNGNYSGFQAASAGSTSQLWTLPKIDGAFGTYIRTDGSGNLAFNTAISSINASGNSAITSSVTFVAGTNATLSQLGNTITINASTQSGGVPSINSAGNSAIVSSATLAASGSVTLTQLGNTITIAASGGGASALGVNNFGVSITSPTAQINFIGPISVSASGSTSTVTLSQISLSTGVTGSLPAASIAPGNLGASVIATSVAVSGVGAGTWGSTTISPVITITPDGRITAVSSATIAGGNSSILFSTGVTAGVSCGPSSSGSPPVNTDTQIFDTGALPALGTGQCMYVEFVSTFTNATNGGSNLGVWYGTSLGAAAQITASGSAASSTEPLVGWNIAICNNFNSQTAQTNRGYLYASNSHTQPFAFYATSTSVNTNAANLHIFITNATSNGSGVNSTAKIIGMRIYQ